MLVKELLLTADLNIIYLAFTKIFPPQEGQALMIWSHSLMGFKIKNENKVIDSIKQWQTLELDQPAVRREENSLEVT